MVVGRFIFESKPSPVCCGNEKPCGGRGGGLTEAVPCRPYLPPNVAGVQTKSPAERDSHTLPLDRVGLGSWLDKVGHSWNSCRHGHCVSASRNCGATLFLRMVAASVCAKCTSDATLMRTAKAMVQSISIRNQLYFSARWY